MAPDLAAVFFSSRSRENLTIIHGNYDKCTIFGNLEFFFVITRAIKNSIESSLAM